MAAVPLKWSPRAETDLSMRRMSDEKITSPTFWPGRPSLGQGENPIIADGELLDLSHTALIAASQAQSDILASMSSHYEYTDRDLQVAQKHLRDAIATIETIRQRIVGAGAVLDEIEKQEG